MNKKELLKGGLDDIFRKYYFDLKERIDKAIEYLKYNACYEEDTKIFCDDLNYDLCSELLNILEGEDNE